MMEKVIWGEVVHPYVRQWYKKEELQAENVVGSWHHLIPSMAVTIFVAIVVGSSAAYLHGIANP